MARPRSSTSRVSRKPSKRLTAKGRRQVKTGKFAGPRRSFPIHDRGHARKALQMAPRSRKVSTAAVRRKVCATYPGLPACRMRSK